MFELFIVVFAHVYMVVMFLSTVGTAQDIQKNNTIPNTRAKVNFYLFLILLSGVIAYWIKFYTNAG